MTVLWAYIDARRVGALEQAGAGLRFTYDRDAQAALSVTLPPRSEAYGDAACRPFFANLLPEGDLRLAVCRALQIAPDDDFGLLGAIGADCAGAVSVVPHDAWKPGAERYRKTTESDLRKWVKQPVTRPSIAVTPGLRLSLAGAQDKLLIHLDEGCPYLCEGGAASTVILKPNIVERHGALELTAVNELASMTLAAGAGLTVPHVFWFASAYAVRRYDRVPGAPRVRRLHQEDLAQVLGVPAVAKYDVGWRECFDAVSRHATVPAKARAELLERLIFNALLGNADAHAKNFALLHDEDGAVALAPAYDLVSTRIYPSIAEKFAMPIGVAPTLEALDRRAWSSFAGETGLSLPFVRRRVHELAERVRALLRELPSRLADEHPGLARDVYPERRRSAFIRKITRKVASHCDLLERSID